MSEIWKLIRVPAASRSVMRCCAMLACAMLCVQLNQGLQFLELLLGHRSSGGQRISERNLRPGAELEHVRVGRLCLRLPACSRTLTPV